MWAKAPALHRAPGSPRSPRSLTWGSRPRAGPREEGLSVARGITGWSETGGMCVVGGQVDVHSSPGLS